MNDADDDRGVSSGGGGGDSLTDLVKAMRSKGWGVRIGPPSGNPILDSRGLIEPTEPLFVLFAVPKEWRTKDSGTA